VTHRGCYISAHIAAEEPQGRIIPIIFYLFPSFSKPDIKIGIRDSAAKNRQLIPVDNTVL
jgi:hypothetical protein